MILSCLLVDDEPLARKVIEEYVCDHPNLKLIASCKTAIDANEILHSETVDLLFLDINMPRLNGISFLRTIENPPKVIIVTAYREFAVEGFELAVSDYLLKPVSFERFLRAINRVLSERKAGAKLPISTQSVPENSDACLFIRVEHKLVKIELESILFLKAYGNYVNFQLLSGKRYSTKRSLHEFEAILPSRHFIKVHRSYIISFDHIESLEGNLLLLKGQRIQISRQYRAAVLERMNLG
ncbi:MAG: LytTR family DNA-binding domain-containing protein [Saprospiraceae bacterium]